MKAFVGTSGWMYEWNRGKSLDWYVSESGLNAIELNASFYRFPFPSQVKHWVKVGNKLSWSIKVNRSITHLYKMNENSYDLFERFLDLFSPLAPYVDNYLFQLPPSFSLNGLSKILDFIKRFDLFDKAVIEPRNISWFNEEVYKEFSKNGISIVSIDAPIGKYIVKTTGKFYLRFHGRTNWYSYDYSTADLKTIKKEILRLKPNEAYLFFNNDHNMLGNARNMLSLF